MPPHHLKECDVLVVGSGNAGHSAAISAAESGAPRVLLIDKCPAAWAGGNSYFTAGAMRAVHSGLDDVLPLVNNVDGTGLASRIDLGPYTARDFLDDLRRVTDGRYDPGLGQVLVGESNAAVKWLAKHGVRYQLSFNRQAYEIGGRFKFWGGMCLKTQDGGKGLVEDHRREARRLGVEVMHDTAATRIATDPSTGRVVGIEAVTGGKDGAPQSVVGIRAAAVVLAAGGFEANPRMRAQYLGHGWDLAHVRGTPYNTGEVLEMAVRDLGARQAGHWSGCHSVAWDADSRASTGDRETSNEFTKSGYPLGITVNRNGERFFDEGSDIRNYTYAMFGKAILGQPGGVAFQVWDGQGIPWLRSEEYRDEVARKTYGDTVEELAATLAKNEGLASAEKLVETVREYNAAVAAHRREHRGLKWDPSVKDGLSTQSSSKMLQTPKSNWALPLTKGPFMAIKVCCGVTFTFGGLAADPETAGVISNTTGRTIPGVYCCGEMLGGLFYENYPGGSGLTAGAVFGRKAGIQAAALAKSLKEGNSPKAML